MKARTRIPRILLEVCTDSVQGAIEAGAAGADRVELCLCLENGGVTPSIGLLREVLSLIRIPVIALVRPRSGGFVYSQLEQRVMLRDAGEALAAGASGLAVGALLPEGTPDMGFLEEIRKLMEGRELVFHRAFDRIPDMPGTLPMLASAGIDRVLTSGGKATAEEGIGMIRELVLRSGGRPVVMPGGAVSPRNIPELVRSTGCRELHGSFSSAFRQAGEDPADPLFPWGGRRTDPELIRLARRALDAL
jgi:copper homeostasis protein